MQNAMSLLAEATNTRHRAILAKLNDLPPFSPVLNQVMASLGDESFSYRHLGSLIEQDMVLTGNVLRLVNSAAYGRRVEVMAISKAISILGINKLRNLVLTLSVAHMWRRLKIEGDWSLERFNSHALVVAILGDAIAQQVDVEFPEGAFLSGLLHDLGTLLIVMNAPADQVAIDAHVALHGSTILEAERLILETDHAALSAAALAVWKLPEPLQRAVRDHHTPVRGELSMIVSVADGCANQLGFSIATPEQTQSETTDAALCATELARLGLESQAAGILADFRTEFEVARSIR
jgi:HD-like signal output (HDOD) protein